MAAIRVGTAGWGIPKEVRDRFPGDGTALERYARVLNCVEINSTFYRSHREATYQRWAQSVPPGFAFSVKMSREITHVRRLVNCDELLARFVTETAALGQRRDVILVQLPPKLAYADGVARNFLVSLRQMYAGNLALEPRHPSWFEPAVADRLASFDVARVAADPAIVPPAALPGGFERLTYIRLHGSPKVYYSAYSPEAIAVIADRLASSVQPWCVFDNTAGGAAIANALSCRDQLVATR